MSSVLKVSDAASIGLHAMVLLAAESRGTPGGKLLSTHEIATTLGVSEAHLSKVLQSLARAGLVSATRGPGGGFGLAVDGGRVSLLKVYEAIEGPLEAQNCLLHTPVCGGKNCIFGGLLRKLNKEVRQYLSAHKLSDLTLTNRAKR